MRLGHRGRRGRRTSRISARQYLPAFWVTVAATLLLREAATCLSRSLVLQAPIAAQELLAASLAALGATLATLVLGGLMAARLRDAGRPGWPAWTAMSAAFLPGTLNRLADLGVGLDHTPGLLAAAGPLLLLCLGVAYAQPQAAASRDVPAIKAL